MNAGQNNLADGKSLGSRLDQVVTSQPGLGPVALDGGFGWFILLASVFIQVLIPSILSSYGTFLLFDQIENIDHDDMYLLWDHEITLVPITFLSFWTLADPWCETLVSTTMWPKLTTTCGIFLICAGNLIAYGAELHEPSIIVYYLLAGAVTGIGASLTMQQCEYLIKQYFRRKYKIAKNVMYLGNILGFVITPLIIGKLIIKDGALESMLIYQIILAQGILASLLFKKPMFKLPETTRYSLLESSSGDEENLVFRKVIDELPPPMDTDVVSSSKETEAQPREPIDLDKIEVIGENPNINLDRIDVLPDESSFKGKRNTATKRRVLNAFLGDENVNVARHNAESSDFPIPIDNVENSTFSYDNNLVYNSISRTVNVPGRVQALSFKESLMILVTPSFFKTLLLQVVGKLSFLVFWVLYPSVLYNELSFLNVHHTITSVTFVAIGGLFFTIFWNCLVIPIDKVKIFLVTSLFLAASGFAVISYAELKSWLIAGGVISTATLSSINVLTEAILLQSDPELRSAAHMLLNTLTGVIILTTVVLDIEYKECFEVMYVLQFATGGIWLSNIIYKSIKRVAQNPVE